MPHGFYKFHFNASLHRRFENFKIREIS